MLALLLPFSTLVQAQGALTYGSVITAEVNAQAPIAIYPFTGTEGDQVTVRVFATTPDVQPTVSLFSPTQQQLATTSGSPFAPGLAELSYSLPATGVYTVFVSSVNNAPGGLVIRLDGGEPPPPVAVDAEVPAMGNLSDAEVVQVFNVQANPGAPIVVTISTSTAGFGYAAALRNDQGALVSLFNGSDTSPVIATLPAGPTTYTFEVRPAVPGSSGDVVLSLDAAETAQPAITATADPAQAVATATTDATPLDATATTDTTAATVAPTVTTDSTACTATTVSATNVRTGPSTDYAVILALQPGQTQTVIGVNAASGWYVIALPDGTEGWVFGDLLTLSGPCDGLTEVAAPSLFDATATVVLTEATAIATASVEPSPTTPVDQPTATLPVDQPTATDTTTFTPTAPGEQPTTAFTPTEPAQQATATFTPSYTPTTPPAPQVAPEDARFNNPLEIPLDNTVSVLDFVSYPDGDREDRVSFSVSGMNPNVAITGGRARLVISASCFGENTDQVQFFTGGQTYTCGQTLVDREVTADSDTGSVVITAVGGEGTYVQWVLTGTATRVN